MVARLEGLTDWYKRKPAHASVPLLASPLRRDLGERTKRKIRCCAPFVPALSKADWQCDQQAKDNRQGLECQCKVE